MLRSLNMSNDFRPVCINDFQLVLKKNEEWWLMLKKENIEKKVI